MPSGVTLIACKKNKTDDTPQELIYAGSSEALSQGRYDIPVCMSGAPWMRTRLLIIW
jgi:hypothetical protein